MRRKITILFFITMIILATVITSACVFQPPNSSNNGEDGLSAFEIWIQAGNEGDMDDFLEWLRGSTGQDGNDGLSAFEIWLEAGNIGTMVDFLEWLRRPPIQVQHFTLTFQNTDFNRITALEGTLIWQPSTPTNGIHEFMGWYRDSSFSARANFPFVLNQDMRLYARWNLIGDYSHFIMNGTIITGLTALGRLQIDIIIPASATSIAPNAFENATNLRTVIFEQGNQMQVFGSNAFIGARNLTSITIPNSTTTIGNSAFQNLANLTSVIFEGGSRLTSIGAHSFGGATSLSNIDIPSSVISIDFGAFRNTVSLTSILIPYSVLNIGNDAFAGWISTQTINVQGRTYPPSGWGRWGISWPNSSNARVVWLG